MEPGYEDMVVERQGRVVIATFNRPEKRNALTPGIREGICRVLQQSAQDAGVRVVVFTGAGDAFCSGANVGDLAARAGSEGRRVIELEALKGGRQAGGFDFAPLFWGFPKPIIAALPGPAVGAGFGLALLCDLRIASERARAAAGFIRMGLGCEYGLSYLLPRTIGLARAYEVLFTGRFLDAAEMLQLGLVNRVVPHEQLLPEALELAQAIARQAPMAVQRIKRAVHHGLENEDFRAQVEYEAYLQSIGLMSEDHQEATRAFLEKREPHFTGR